MADLLLCTFVLSLGSGEGSLRLAGASQLDLPLSEGPRGGLQWWVVALCTVWCQPVYRVAVPVLALLSCGSLLLPPGPFALSLLKVVTRLKALDISEWAAERDLVISMGPTPQ